MSSVVIAGNTSGSVTLLAPDVAGSVVVTLPSSSMTLAAGPGGMQAFTANGTFTIPAGKTAVKVTIVGGGGGSSSGSAIAGAGAGGAAISVLTGLTPGATLTVTIGAGGIAGVNPNPAGNGGTSSITSGTQTISTISATGGASGNNSDGGLGGSGSGGQLNLKGTSGGLAGAINNPCFSIFISGIGGPSIFGGGGGGGGGVGVAVNGSNGGGAGGNGTAGGNGGVGGTGIVVFEW